MGIVQHIILVLTRRVQHAVKSYLGWWSGRVVNLGAAVLPAVYRLCEAGPCGLLWATLDCTRLHWTTAVVYSSPL